MSVADATFHLLYEVWLKVLDIILSIINFISTWRFCVCVVMGVSVAMFVSEKLQVGVLSIGLSMLAIAVGFLIGCWWQENHERKDRE